MIRCTTSPRVGRVIPRPSVSPAYFRRIPSHMGGRYFFDRVITENKEEFESIYFQKEVLKLALNGAEKAKEKLKNKFAEVLPFFNITKKIPPSGEMIDMDLDLEYSLEYSFHRNSPSVIIPISPDIFYLISKTKEDAKNS